MTKFLNCLVLGVLLLSAHGVWAEDLIIAHNGQTSARIVVSPDAGQWEKQAALDLQKYIALMSGAKPAVLDTPEAIAAAQPTNEPVFWVGSEALKADLSLQTRLDQIKKSNPFLRADAIVLQRRRNQILLAGSNDESHYFAVIALLNLWGCRWYLPGEIGECIPDRSTLSLGELEVAYAPPFEIRRSLNRRGPEVDEYQRRNFASSAKLPASMGSLHQYTKDLASETLTVYQVPLAEPATAEHIAAQLDKSYVQNVPSIAIAPFIQEYSIASELDKQLNAGVVTKYLNMPSSSDAMVTMYNNVARILREKHPHSTTKILGIGLASAFLPPQRAFTPAPNLMIWLVPVNHDPIHAMDSALSPSRQEWRALMERWSHVMQGRIAIHDYDVPMLVWRELPAPNLHAFERDVEFYRAAGILGLSPESRGSVAVNFLNMFTRAQLLWNPDAKVDELLDEFYPRFYGPASAPMRNYWQAIFAAWQNTVVTEHEHFIVPAIYTPQLMQTLRANLQAAEAEIAPLHNKTNLSRHEKLYLERLRMARLSFDVLEHYTAMVAQAATHAEYSAAVEAGQRGLDAVLALVKFAPNLTPDYDAKLETLQPGGRVTTWPGEVAQYARLQSLTDGTTGKLILKTPLEWAFRRDPNDTGLASGWAYKPVDLSYWNANKEKYSGVARKDYPTTQWEMLRTDLYLQAQGVLHPDGQSFTGFAWYHTELELTGEQAKAPLHLMFSGLFNEAWLYVNGHLVAHREQNALWALNDYAFEWDVDLAGVLRPGKNSVTLRLDNSMYMGGIFRRPFIYSEVK